MNEVKRGPGRPRKKPPEQLKGDNPCAQVPLDNELYGGMTEERINRINLRVYIHPFFRGEDKGDGGIRRVFEAQAKWLPKFGIDLVDSPADADLIACHATMDEKFPRLYPEKTFVAMCHGMYWSTYEWGNWALKANADVIENLRVSDSVATCSEWVANSIRRNVSKPVSVIPHGIDMEDWPSLEAKDYVLWNKTRPDPICDPEPLNLVAEILPQTKFITTFGREAPNVAVTGKLPFAEAKKLIQSAGVYLCTARETFGIGTLEALACGVPVVGFNWGGQAEFIEHMVDGYLVTPGDIYDLAKGIRWALENRAEISPRARLKAMAYSWEIACKQYAELFKQTHAIRNKPGPKVSVIVTNYNLHEYLTDCLKSVQNQEGDWECIVVDDASTDATGKFIAQTFADEDRRFRIVRNEKNVYLSEARNVGIRLAKGRYIIPLDADDMLAPNTITILSSALDRDRTIQIAYGNVLFIDEELALVNYGRNLPLGHSGWPIQFSYEQQIMQRNLLPYCSMFRKEVWENTGGYRRRCRTAEDADLWTRVSSYGYRPKMVTDQDTLIYRIRPDSMSQKQGYSDWIRWFPWAKIPEITPAGAVSVKQFPVPACDPIIISVIIPVGPGHEKLVTDAVDSVDCQTFRNWECIVINDTGIPLATELPAWVKVINTEGKTGPAHARNVGIKASKGRLFLPLDADDYLEPDALQLMLDTHAIDREVIYSDFWQTDMNGKNITIHECDDYDPELITGKKRMVKNAVREGMIHSVTALTPKAYWEKVGGYDEKMPAWEDWDFQLSLANIGVCSRRIAMPLFFYRKHTGFRREDNYSFFEKSKEAIIHKWGHLWKGDKLMACGSCGTRRSVTPLAKTNMLGAPSRPSGEAMLLEYIGAKQGSFPMRGISRTMYFFGKGDIKYVLTEDAQRFMRDYPQDFAEVRSPEQRFDAPVLVAEGPPA